MPGVYQFDLYDFLDTIIAIRIRIATLYPASLHFDVVAISFLQLKANISGRVAYHFFKVIFDIPVQRQEPRKYFVVILAYSHQNLTKTLTIQHLLAQTNVQRNYFLSKSRSQRNLIK